MRHVIGKPGPGSMPGRATRLIGAAARLAAGGALVTLVLLAVSARASGPQTPVPEYFSMPIAQSALVDGTAFSTRDPFARSLLYLHLSGRFSEQHRSLFASLIATPEIAPAASPAFEWRQLVMAATGGQYLFNTRKYVSRAVTSNGRALTRNWFFDNCQADALTTAIATFNERRARYGESSPDFGRWLAAQQQVFANCAETELSLPAPPEDSWAPLAQQDRRYQIAASYLYNMQYRVAAEHFDSIAADSTSPWADVSRYLVARSLVREATTNGNDVERNLREALARFRGMAAEGDYVTRYPSIAGLIRYIEIQLDTPGFMHGAAERLLESPERLTASELDDLLYLIRYREFDSATDAALEPELLRWHRLAQDPSAAATLAIDEQWQRSRNPAWLYLAIHRPAGGADRARAEAGRAALATLDPATPAYAAMLIEVAERLAASGDAVGGSALARQALTDAALGLLPEQRNRLNYLLARQIADPIERLAESDLTPVAMRIDSAEFAAQSAETLRQATRGGTLFPDDTVAWINSTFTPAMLMDAVERIELNDYLRGRLVIAAWTRSVLIGDDATANRAAAALAEAFPELAGDLERFVAGEDRDFLAARIVLTHPGFSPLVPTGIGRYRYSGDGMIFPAATVALPLRAYNWWCNAGSTLPTATEFFAPAVMARAQANPDDSSLPHTLHRLVFATRHACDSGPGEVSRAAFELLHRRYPDSEWAEKTPYWYR